MSDSPKRPSSTPALDWFLRDGWVDYGPNGSSCEDCPFALTGPMDADMTTPFDQDWHGGWNGNTDRSEAYYKCGLPNSESAAKDKVWGEYPKCTEDEWRAVARTERATEKGSSEPCGYCGSVHGFEPCDLPERGSEVSDG